MRILLSSAIAETFADRLRELDAAIEVVVLHPDGSVTPSDEGIEVAFKSEDIGSERETLLRLAEHGGLRWLHSSSAGIDRPFYGRLRALDVTFTHSPGIHAIPIAEWVITHMLHFARHVEDYREQQLEREWRLQPSEELHGRTIGIVGYGGIGRAVAKLARAFGMETIATRRTPVEGDPNLDRWLPPARLDELIDAADYLVLCAPLTEETRGMLDARRLARLRPHVVLLNVGRGPLIDEAALVEVLREGRIRGAALDVFEQEPLPASSELWSLPNCVVSPHDSGETVATPRRTTELFLTQLRRYLDGEPLLHLIQD